MDNEKVREFLAYHQDIRSQLLADLDGYESGVHYTGELRGGERVDTTERTVADLKSRLTRTEGVIAAYRATLDAPRP